MRPPVSWAAGARMMIGAGVAGESCGAWGVRGGAWGLLPPDSAGRRLSTPQCRRPIPSAVAGLSTHLPIIYSNVKSLSQEPCRRELYEVLERLAEQQQGAGGAGPHRFYLPNCHRSGFYHPKQVRPLAKPRLPLTVHPAPHAPRTAPKRVLLSGIQAPGPGGLLRWGRGPGALCP